jgi:hypothetical protein
MTRARVFLSVTAIVAAVLTLVLSQPSAASPCKPLGQVCPTNMSCCSRNCAKPAVKHGTALFGLCCPAGDILCGGTTCANLATDPNNCGTCGSVCTSGEICSGGVCVNPCGTCSALDQCHDVGTCNPSTGVCSNPVKSDGSPCNDGNACTQTDTCQTGTCVGANPVVCTAQDQCHVAGTCDPAAGACSNPAAADGTACNDGNACTQTDTCQAGTCVGANPVNCDDGNICTVDFCDLNTGVCDHIPAVGVPCSCPNGTMATCNAAGVCGC